MPRSIRHARHQLAAALLLLTASAAAADDIGADAAKRLLGEGRILPLTQILDRVKAAVPGEMLQVELELDDGRYQYEVKLLRPDGRIQEVEVDAANGTILKIEDDD